MNLTVSVALVEPETRYGLCNLLYAVAKYQSGTILPVHDNGGYGLVTGGVDPTFWGTIFGCASFGSELLSACVTYHLVSVTVSVTKVNLRDSSGEVADGTFPLRYIYTI